MPPIPELEKKDSSLGWKKWNQDRKATFPILACRLDIQVIHIDKKVPVVSFIYIFIHFSHLWNIVKKSYTFRFFAVVYGTYPY